MEGGHRLTACATAFAHQSVPASKPQPLPSRVRVNHLAWSDLKSVQAFIAVHASRLPLAPAVDRAILHHGQDRWLDPRKTRSLPRSAMTWRPGKAPHAGSDFSGRDKSAVETYAVAEVSGHACLLVCGSGNLGVNWRRWSDHPAVLCRLGPCPWLSGLAGRPPEGADRVALRRHDAQGALGCYRELGFGWQHRLGVPASLAPAVPSATLRHGPGLYAGPGLQATCSPGGSRRNAPAAAPPGSGIWPLRILSLRSTSSTRFRASHDSISLGSLPSTSTKWRINGQP